MLTQLVRPLLAVGLLVTALLFASPSLAVEPVVDTAPTYEDLIARRDALPSSLEAVARYEAAVARADQARALPNPSIAYDMENVYGTGPYNGIGNAETT
ncbi:MAG: TolC family protein, partial [Rhodanobacter sp.]|nr:TolC family protein [Rhodanobacter sp.]